MMGFVFIDLGGSFGKHSFTTTVKEGGHVAALKRAMVFLAEQLGPAVKKDLAVTQAGEKLDLAPLGEDRE